MTRWIEEPTTRHNIFRALKIVDWGFWTTKKLWNIRSGTCKLSQEITLLEHEWGTNYNIKHFIYWCSEKKKWFYYDWIRAGHGDTKVNEKGTAAVAGREDCFRSDAGNSRNTHLPAYKQQQQQLLLLLNRCTLTRYLGGGGWRRRNCQKRNLSFVNIKLRGAVV